MMGITKPPRTHGVQFNSSALILVGILLLSLHVHRLLVVGTAYETSHVVRILVVASDMEDVVWGHRIGVVLSKKLEGARIDIDVLYMGKDYPSAGEERTRLRDLAFLWKYDAILLPDLNKPFMFKGRLNNKEISNLLRYVKGGHVIFLGMNTLIHNWSKDFESSTGTRIIGLASAREDTHLFDIRYHGTVLHYNDTYGAVYVSVISARVIAYFINGYPALTVNRLGNGLVFFAEFNVVKGVIEQSDGDKIANMISDVLVQGLEEVNPEPLPTSIRVTKALTSIVSMPQHVYQVLVNLTGSTIISIFILFALILLLMFIILLVAFHFCLLPRRIGMMIAKLAVRENELDHRVLSLLRKHGPMSITKLREELKVSNRKLCRTLLRLEANKLIISITENNVTKIATSQDKALLLLDDPLNEKIVIMATEEPGITVSEIAARLGAPLDIVYKRCKNLARYGVIELRKVLNEYEIYPITSISTRTGKGKEARSNEDTE